MSGRRGLGAPWRRRRPLRTRLALAVTAAVALVAVAVCAGAFLVVRAALYHQLDLSLTQSARLAAQRNPDSAPGSLAGECRFLAAPACAEVVPADPSADPARPGLLPVRPAAREVAAGERAPYYTDITLAGHPARMLTTDYAAGRALQVALRADPVEDGIEQASRRLVLAAVAGVLLAAVLGYGVSRTGLAPVTRLTATAERIAATRDPRHRIELPPPGRQDEITRLAESFNTMLGELEQSVTAQRRLVADASHELRTPLTALRTNAELLARADRLTPEQRQRASAALGRQLREVTNLVGDLIELARDEEPRQLVERVRLGALVEHCVDAAREHWPAVAFQRSAPDGDPAVSGVPARLSRLVGNLLDNAAKFSAREAAGLPVEVDLRVPVPGGGPELTVRDHGPGIDEKDLPHVFDRFYRAGVVRALPGSGLGLAMARQIALAHGAELTAEHAPGGGALFRLTFPAGP
ncbi:HAMP domain-containing sensor histidine kinase [Streptomyces sp. NPDC048606]|uniref:sensor histidine kinase n=1 Tax=Streptomyces sp. NPDC048606 TaxID=3154726 RepID=UPI00341B5FFC